MRAATKTRKDFILLSSFLQFPIHTSPVTFERNFKFACDDPTYC